MGKKNRKCSKIDRLPVNIKETVEQMMLDPTFTYKQIVDYINQNGYETSLSGVQRHAQSLNESVTNLRMTQENFKVIMSELEKHPNLDTTEGIMRLLSGYMLEAINKTSEETWQTLELKDLLKQSIALTRAAAYKSRVDVTNKDNFEKGLDYVKTMVFNTMAKQEPKLYKEVVKFLENMPEADAK